RRAPRIFKPAEYANSDSSVHQVAVSLPGRPATGIGEAEKGPRHADRIGEVEPAPGFAGAGGRGGAPPPHQNRKSTWPKNSRPTRSISAPSRVSFGRLSRRFEPMSERRIGPFSPGTCHGM